jgi:flavodoxin
VRSEQNKGTARPALAAKVENMSQYDTVFLGWPTWMGTMPMAVCTFLESYDFSNKIIYPFNTNGGSQFGSSLSLLKKEAPHAVIKEGLSIYALDDNPNNDTVEHTPDKRVTQWLDKFGLRGKRR